MSAPSEIRLKRAEQVLEVAWPDGARFRLPAEYLRVESPSAEVQGHSPDQRKTVPGKREVAILGVEPVGSYAVRLRFDDMHDSGIYTWDYLHELGTKHAEKWAAYCDELAAKGLSRERVRRG